MRRFNFEIIPSAQLTCRPKREVPTRELLRSMIAKHRRRRLVQENAANALAPESAFPIHKPALQIAPRLGSKPRAPCISLRIGNHFDYRSFVISTIHSAPREWIAYFGRPDGGLIVWDGIAQSIVQTATHQAEALAVADAKLSIDELLESESAENSELTDE
jgi:hypothetical protein